jgi:hypothetical protein
MLFRPNAPGHHGRRDRHRASTSHNLSRSLISLLSVVGAVLTAVTVMGSISTAGAADDEAERPHPSHPTHPAHPTHPTHPPHPSGPTSAATSPTTPPTGPTSPSSPPTSTSSPGWSCVTSDPSGNCGPYHFAGIANSNGYNTYVGNDCWADPTCKQTVSANSPSDWQVVANEPEGNTAVMTYPDVQQLFNNWCGSGWNGCANPTDTPLSALSDLSFGYSLTMPGSSSGTIAQAAYDVWTSDPTHREIMIWVDNDNRESGGASFDASYTTSDGQEWSLYHYGDEIIWSLGREGTFAQRTSYADVPVYELMKYLVDNGYEDSSSLVGQIDFGWEICSTGGGPQTFTVNAYSITAR